MQLHVATYIQLRVRTRRCGLPRQPGREPAEPTHAEQLIDDQEQTVAGSATAVGQLWVRHAQLAEHTPWERGHLFAAPRVGSARPGAATQTGAGKMSALPGGRSALRESVPPAGIPHEASAPPTGTETCIAASARGDPAIRRPLAMSRGDPRGSPRSELPHAQQMGVGRSSSGGRHPPPSTSDGRQRRHNLIAQRSGCPPGCLPDAVRGRQPTRTPTRRDRPARSGRLCPHKRWTRLPGVRSEAVRIHARQLLLRAILARR